MCKSKEKTSKPQMCILKNPKTQKKFNIEVMTTKDYLKAFKTPL